MANLQGGGGIEGKGSDQVGPAWVHTGNQHVNHGKGEMLAKGSSETLSSGSTHQGLFTLCLLAPEAAHVVE